MITKVLIFLVAVVVLIVIIAVLALRFLRADDSDSFDDIPDEPRRPGRAPEDDRRLEPALTERSRQPRLDQARNRHRGADRGRPIEDLGQGGYRERDSQPRVASPERNGSPPAKRPATTGARGAPTANRAAATSRSGQARAPESEAASWEALSDVDYWTELAAEKPMTSSAAAPASPGRRGSDGAVSHPDGRPAGRGEQPGHLPVRHRPQRRAAQSAGRADPGQTQQSGARPAHAPGRFVSGGSEPATQSIAALARLGGQQSSATSRPSLPQPQPSRAPQHQPPSRPPSSPALPAPAAASYSNGRSSQPTTRDDDPLTSPSFPAINAADSRSYRTQRSGGHQIPGRDTGGFGESAQAFATYQTDHSAANGYVSHGAVAPAMPSVPAQPAAGTAAGNPYGSFVNQPAASYQEPAGTRPDAGGYPGYSPVSQQAAPAANGTWYAAPAESYLPAANGTQANGTHANGTHANGTHANGTHANGTQANSSGYTGSDYYQAAYQGATYHAAPADPRGYPQQSYLAGQYDQFGYAAPDLGYGREGYQGYSGGYGGNQ